MSRIIQFAMKAASTGALVCICATAAGQQVLPGHVPEAISHLHSLGRLAATNEINLAISLPLRNQSELTSFLAQLYDPASTNFHKYLTPQEFTERFGPAAAEYEALKTFVQSNHFAVTGAFDNRLLLNVSGKVTEIEHTFHVTLNRFHHPTGARDFYAPDREPSVNTSVPLLRIYGLDNFDRPRCFARPQPIGGDFNGSSGSGGSVPGGYLRGKDFRNAYLPGVTLDGSGQMVGLVEFDGYYPSDIATYESQAGLPNVPLKNVLINTGAFAPSGVTNSVGEVSLDIEMVISMATNLTKLYVFESSSQSSANWVTMLNSMASSNQIRQFSSSWGWNSPLTNSDQYFQTMAAQGQTFFQAVGDGGAFIYPVPWPGDSPYVTSVGGTTLTMTNFGTTYVAETVWNSGFLGTNNAWYGNGHSGYWASGGGASTTYSIPSWQLGVNLAGIGGSTFKRNVPDVALTANQIWVNYFNGLSANFIGTSCAAPLWAGFTALVNQQCAADNRPPVGFLNPALYALGKNGGTSFHDITTGNNFWSTNLFYSAAAGYDLCTGWGSPTANLVSALENFSGAVWVDFSVAGPGAGTYDNPYNTLALGTANVAANGAVAIKGPNSTPVTPVISKPLILNASGGSVVIGQ